MKYEYIFQSYYLQMYITLDIKNDVLSINLITWSPKHGTVTRQLDLAQ